MDLVPFRESIHANLVYLRAKLGRRCTLLRLNEKSNNQHCATKEIIFTPPKRQEK